jgi:hypothetical protein
VTRAVAPNADCERAVGWTSGGELNRHGDQGQWPGFERHQHKITTVLRFESTFESADHRGAGPTPNDISGR